MESDLGKLFIGGISWDTNEESLREYFSNYGEVVEAVIMKDRTTGRARGFGFVVFADPTVAERVVMEKHTIDGRVVEAKKAVPRDDQHVLNRNSNISAHGSPGPARTRKIFVGGLASTVTETNFKKYFDQFGTITDVVVMYDHNTQRPRGFGFITYDSEDAVDKVLLKTFHELNGKMVEVKRAVPKELSPGPITRSPIGNYSNYGLNRVSNLNFLNGYAQGFGPSSIRGYGMRMDGRHGSLISGRGGYSPFSNAGYGIGMNVEGGPSPSYIGNTNYNNNFGYGRGLSPYYTGNSGRYSSPVGYNGLNGGTGSMINSNTHNVWGGTGLNYGTAPANSTPFLGSGSGSFGVFGDNGINWGGSSISTQVGRSGSGYGSGNLGYGSGDNNYGLRGSSYGRSSGTGDMNSSYTASSALYDGAYADLCADVTWRSASSELDGSSPFDFGLGSVASDNAIKDSTGYNAGYNATDRQSSRGIAA